VNPAQKFSFTLFGALPRVMSCDPFTLENPMFLTTRSHVAACVRRASLPAFALTLLLAACAGSFDESTAHAAGLEPWPPAWQDTPQDSGIDFTTPSFDAPSASNCHRLPTTTEVSGGGRQAAGGWRRGREDEVARDALSSPPLRKESKAAGEPAALAESHAAPASKSALAGGLASDASTAFAPSPWPQPSQTVPQRPAHETVTAGVVDDNADFGEYLNYRQRHTGLPVHERDISERYLLEVTDALGRPVHDAEVAVQRAGVAEPVMWARTDTAGRVWLHPRAFISPNGNDERALSVAVRKGGVQGRAALLRGQMQAVQLRLNAQPAATTRLDLVFLIDATGSMGDEIAKLKTSMHAMAQQISQLPGRPDICYGLVAYRDRGDVYLTRTHDFTDNLGAFQKVLANVQASGGGDTPEALNEALHEVVHGLSWRAV